MELKRLDENFRAEVDRYIEVEWGGPMVVTLGNLYDTSGLPGFVMVEDGKLLGALLYRIEGGDFEVSTLFALVQGRGIGRSLLDAAVRLAREASCNRVWLITTNDNTQAIRFYQIYGFALKAVHIGAFEVTRRLKGELPQKGIDGIPIQHEFEFEMVL